jgi:hypothetical protein
MGLCLDRPRAARLTYLGDGCMGIDYNLEIEVIPDRDGYEGARGRNREQLVEVREKAQ